MSWEIKNKKYAGHTIRITFTEYDNKLTADIKGPRASTNTSKTYVNGITWKLGSRIPFKSPSPRKIEDKAWEMYKTARKRIDKAIAEHHKKKESQYS